MSWAAAALAMSAVSALGQIRAGQAQGNILTARGQGLNVEAKFKRLEGRREALKDKKVVVDKLTEVVAALATTNAAAGAGNIDPFSGNPLGLKIKTRKVGGTDALVAKENAAITILLFNEQAKQLEFAAQQAFAAAGAARSAGVTNALFTLGSSFAMFGMSGGFSAAPTAGAGAGATAGAGQGLKGVPSGLPSLGNTMNNAPFRFQGFGTSAPNAAGTIGI